MTLGEHLHETAERMPDKTALICRDESLAYREFDAKVTRLALGLQAQGIEKGDRVALHLTNTIELVLSYFACFRLGAIAVPVNSRLKTNEIAYILQHSGARMYIGEPELYEIAAPTRASCPKVARYVVTSQRGVRGAAAGFDELPAGSREGDLPDVSDSDVAAILYTSGTTARPKGVTHTHATLRECGRVTCQVGFREDDTFALFTPVTHASGLNCSLIPGVLLGMTIVLIPRFEPSSVLAEIEGRSCTAVVGLPMALQMLVRQQVVSQRDVGSLRICAAGGDSVARPLQAAFQEAFGVPVQEVIGMTEAVPTCLNRVDRIKTGSVGQAADGVEVRIVDQQGNEEPVGEVGEMVVRHPGTAIGYWNNAEATAQAIRDGWLHTGDLAFRDEDGFYWFAGRTKEVIIRGGSNISPQEVEGVLLKHPAVFQAGVVGAPDPMWSESVVAFVRLHDGQSCTETELIEFAKEHIADYKAPEQIRFIDEMPLGLTGKVSRRTLKAMAGGRPAHRHEPATSLSPGAAAGANA